MNTPVTTKFIDQKIIISFVLGLLIGALLIGIVFSSPCNKSTKEVNSSTKDKVLTNEVLQKRELTKQKILSNSGARQPQVIRENSMPWDVASNFIVNAPVEKIEVLSGLSIKLFMKNGPIFISTQPKQDAYLEFVKQSGKTIQIVK